MITMNVPQSMRRSLFWSSWGKVLAVQYNGIQDDAQASGLIKTLICPDCHGVIAEVSIDLSPAVLACRAARINA
jgi:hypothetical protein